MKVKLMTRDQMSQLELTLLYWSNMLFGYYVRWNKYIYLCTAYLFGYWFIFIANYYYMIDLKAHVYLKDECE